MRVDFVLAHNMFTWNWMAPWSFCTCLEVHTSAVWNAIEPTFNHYAINFFGMSSGDLMLFFLFFVDARRCQHFIQTVDFFFFFHLFISPFHSIRHFACSQYIKEWITAFAVVWRIKWGETFKAVSAFRDFIVKHIT